MSTDQDLQAHLTNLNDSKIELAIQLRIGLRHVTKNPMDWSKVTESIKVALVIAEEVAEMLKSQ